MHVYVRFQDLSTKYKFFFWYNKKNMLIRQSVNVLSAWPTKYVASID